MRVMTPRQIASVVYRHRRLILGGFVLMFSVVLMLAWSRSGIQTPAPSYLLVDRHGEYLTQIHSPGQSDFGYWKLKRLPPRVVKATVTLEDKHFWQHIGVDPLAMLRAFWQNLSSQRRISGASTLAMQLVRLQRPASRTYANKAIESLAAIFMTMRYGREQILRHYLRQVPYGNRVHGIVYAARRYLNKPVADLSWAEIAFLAAIPQSPGRMNPFDRKGRLRAIRRGSFLLAQLYQERALSKAQYDIALDELKRINPPRQLERPEYAMHAIEYLKQRLLSDTPPVQGGLIKTTLDLDLQTDVTLTSRRLLQQWRRNGAGNLALIILDRKRNDVLAWIGSADYFDKAHAGAIDYTQIKRSPGSTLKPFIYALALERGKLLPNQVLDDLPFAGYPFRNSDHRFLGPMLPRQALANSRNIPAIRVLNSVGMDAAYYLFRRLQLHRQTVTRDIYGLGLAIGSMPVRLADLACAYSVLANGGVYRSLNWFSGHQAGHQQRIFSRATARLLSLWLSDPMARLPTFPRMGTEEYPFPVAVKTGTSQGYRDAWTVAYSERYLVAAWVGNADLQPMYKMSGAGSAADLVQQVLLKLQQKQDDGVQDLGFPPPAHYVNVDLCGISGKLASADCDYHVSEWLPRSEVPHEKDDSYIRLSVDTRTDLPATVATPDKYRKLRTFVNLPAQYADWVVQNNLRMANGKTGTTLDASLPSRSHVQLRIVSPQVNGHYLRNPDAPATSNDIAFSVVVNPPVKQILWYVDNRPYKLSEYPYTTRWQLQNGKHEIEARVPFTHERSGKIAIYIDN